MSEESIASSRDQSTASGGGDDDVRQRPSLAVNALSNWAALVVNVAIGFVLTPIVIAHVGKAGYGIWTLVGSVIGYYGLLDMGVTNAVMRYVARYAAQGDDERLNATANTALLLSCVIGALLAVASFLVGHPLAAFFDVPADKVIDFVPVVELLGMAAAVRLVGGAFRVVILAHERFVASNIVVIATSLLRAGLTLWLLRHGWELLGVACSHLAAAIVMIASYVVLCRVLIPEMRLRPRFVRMRVLRLLLGFGGVTTVIAITDMLRFNLDSFVIAKWVSLPAVGVYGVAAVLIHHLVRFVITTIGVVSPRLAALDGTGDTQGFRRLFLKSMLLSGVIAFSLGALAVVFGGRFIALWVGPGFSEAGPVLVVLAVGHAVAAAQNPGLSAMYALRKHHWYAAATSIEAVLNVVLSIALAPRYGIMGVAIGTTVPMLLARAIGQPIYVARILGLPLVRYYAHLLPGFVIAASIVPLVSLIGAKMFASNDYVSLSVQVGLVCALSAGVFALIPTLICYCRIPVPWDTGGG